MIDDQTVILEEEDQLLSNLCKRWFSLQDLC